MCLKPGKGFLSPLDVNLSEELQRLAARKKMERTAAFRQLQGYSKQLSVLTKGRVDLSFFELPQRYEIRAVAQHEKRCTVRGDTEDESFIVACLLFINYFIVCNNEMKSIIWFWLSSS